MFVSNIHQASGINIPNDDNSQYRKFYHGKIIENKVYIHPNLVQITSNGIAIHINNELVLVPLIESDGHGIYINTQHLAGYVNSGDWCCEFCWKWNSSSRSYCFCCGTDRPEEE